MMELVRARIAEGRTDQQIIDELISAYGGSLLLDPPPSGPTLWLWLAPLLALGVGGAMIAGRFRSPPANAGLEPVARTPTISPRRMWGAVILVVAGAVAIATIGQFQQARPDDQTFSGIAGGNFDPDSVSNETLEAVIAANADHPQINGMRLALANRYFEEGNYQNAFGHFQTVLENAPTAGEAANSFARLGWMVFDGNGEADLGLELIDRGLGLVPNDAFALYLKGRILWCGKDDPDAAAQLFQSVLSSPDLGPDVLATIERDLDAVQSGESCA
jgi:tetratricopeptide (TPR) repeat protein